MAAMMGSCRAPSFALRGLLCGGSLALAPLCLIAQGYGSRTQERSSAVLTIRSDLGVAGTESAARAAIDEAWDDLVSLTGADPSVLASRGSLTLHLVPDGEHWHAAASSPADAIARADAMGATAGIASLASRKAHVLVPGGGAVLDRVPLPSVSRQAVLHEGFHLVFEDGIEEARALPLWFREGAAWAFADRALHRTLGERDCPSCALGLGLLRGSAARRHFRGARACLEQDTPSPLWVFETGLLLRTAIDEAEWRSDSSGTLHWLIEALAVLPHTATPDEELEALLRFASLDEAGLDAAVRARLRSLSPAWILTPHAGTLDRLEDGSILLAPAGSTPAEIRWTIPPRRDDFRFAVTARLLDPRGILILRLGTDAGGATFATAWTLEPGRVLFERGTGPSGTEWSQPFPLDPPDSKSKTGSPSRTRRIAIELYENALRAFLPPPRDAGAQDGRGSPDALAARPANVDLREGLVAIVTDRFPVILSDPEISPLDHPILPRATERLAAETAAQGHPGAEESGSGRGDAAARSGPAVPPARAVAPGPADIPLPDRGARLARRAGVPFRLAADAGGPPLGDAALAALGEAWPDFAILSGLPQRELLERGPPLSIHLVSPGPHWDSVVERLFAARKEFSPSTTRIGGVTSTGTRSSHVLVPPAAPSLFREVPLPAVVRATLLHESFHLAFDLGLSLRKGLPQWFHEGAAWAFADRALHRTNGAVRCTTCATAVGSLPGAPDAPRLPPLGKILADRAPTPSLVFGAGILIRVLLEETGRTQGGDPPARSLAPLARALEALPEDVDLTVQQAVLEEFAGMPADAIEARMRGRVDALPLAWQVPQGMGQIDPWPPGNAAAAPGSRAILLAPMHGKVAFALLKELPPAREFRVELIARILEPGGSMALEAGFGGPAPPIALSLGLDSADARFQEKGAAPRQVVRYDPFPLFPGGSPPAPGQRFRVGLRFDEDVLRAYLPEDPSVLSPPHPRRPGTAFGRSHLAVLAYDGPIVIEEIRLLPASDGR